jgi:acyl-CoA reductase-like NAD-dependent aldehyde dehydrogenase
MAITNQKSVPLSHADKFFIGGNWQKPSSDSVIHVIDATSEERAFSVAEAQAADMNAAVAAAREAFDRGPWPRMTHAERAGYVRALAAELRARSEDVAQVWPRESGTIYSIAGAAAAQAAGTFEYYAGLAGTFAFEQPMPSTVGEFGLLVREPVGVVGAIIPWNVPLGLVSIAIPPALIAGCTVILKSSPEAPGEGLIIAEVAEAVGLPPGVLNIVTADREVSELLVRDPRVDKIIFTGSTATGRRIGSLCGERIARCTLELGGKSAALILADADIAMAARTLAAVELPMTGQMCSSLTRIVVPRARHDEFVDALSSSFSSVRVGDPYHATTQMGPLASKRQRDRVESYISKGVADGAVLATGGGRPKHLERGWFVEPTVFGNVDNRSTIAQEEIFGPVLSVIPADDEEQAIDIANDTIYGLNAAVFTNDVDHARRVAGRLQSGTIGQNGFKTDYSIAFGGFKQSGIGREGGVEGLLSFLETKTVILDGKPVGYHDWVQPPGGPDISMLRSIRAQD